MTAEPPFGIVESFEVLTSSPGAVVSLELELWTFEVAAALLFVALPRSVEPAVEFDPATQVEADQTTESQYLFWQFSLVEWYLHR